MATFLHPVLVLFFLFSEYSDNENEIQEWVTSEQRVQDLIVDHTFSSGFEFNRVISIGIGDIYELSRAYCKLMKMDKTVLDFDLISLQHYFSMEHFCNESVKGWNLPMEAFNINNWLSNTQI